MKIKIDSICDDLTPFLKILKKYNFKKGYIILHSIDEIYKMIEELDKVELEGMANNRGVIFSNYEKENTITIIDGYLG